MMSSNQDTLTPSLKTPSPIKGRLHKFIGTFSPCHLDQTPPTTPLDKYGLLGTRDIPQSPKSRFGSLKINRHKQKVLLGSVIQSFDLNQSCPRIGKSIIREIKMDTPSKLKTAAELVRVDGPNGLRFNTSLGNLAFQCEASSLVASSQSQSDRISQGLNLNKSVFTIDTKSSKILIVNSKACSLLGYSSSELCSMKFTDLLKDKTTNKIPVRSPTPEANSEEGTIIVLSGKVVELLNGEGGIVLVSLWIRQLDSDGPCLVVAEPVHTKQAFFTIESDTGLITACDGEDANVLFQVDSNDKLIGLSILSLIPSIKLPEIQGNIPKHIGKQKATGRTLDGITFPLCLWIKNEEGSSSENSVKENMRKYYNINIRVFHNVSGLLVVDESGLVSACNHHFTMLTFGKSHTEIIGQPVTQIIPNFCQEMQLVKVCKRGRQFTLSPVPNNDNSDTETDPSDSRGGNNSNSSKKSACTSYNITNSQLSQITQDKSSSAMFLDKSSSALCLEKSSSYINTHTPTPTQDMVSSISTTEHKIDHDGIPEIQSGMSTISMEEDPYSHTSISKSRSENILASENRENNLNLANKNSENKSSDKSDSVYFTTSLKPIQDSGTGHRTRLNDPSMRLSLDSSKYRQIKNALAAQAKDDKSSVSLDFCDSNETSADFLTPINELPASCDGIEIPDEIEEDIPKTVGYLDCENGIDSSLQVSLCSPKDLADSLASETPSIVKRLPRSNLTTSTPHVPNRNFLGRQENQSVSTKNCDTGNCLNNCQHKDGTYKGIILHKDGTELNIVYTVSSLQLSASSRVQYVWLGVQAIDEPSLAMHTTLASSISSTAENSLAMGNKSATSRPHSLSVQSQCGDENSCVDFSKNYNTLKLIGKGGYGRVMLAYRRSDRLLVIAKFILKEKLTQEMWVDSKDENGKKIPMEVKLLMTLSHPNIVTVFDVYESDKSFQMVMEKHGSGMDLFEFIERRPQLDEPLLSYIFRQVAHAVEYLHSLSILHRDIKEENMIIDNKFHVKLIDFGSATYMKENTLFDTFYGTTEYCSPEVLSGNKYAGPELEMWAMGVTLFVLTFFVNPFTDIEGIIQGPLNFPGETSPELEHLLRWMLCKEVSERCTVPRLVAHSWLRQPVLISKYSFADIVECEPSEANPETYYTGLWGSSRTNSPPGDILPKDLGQKPDGKNISKDDPKRNSFALHALSAADKDAQSDNYSLRSSADILDISSKPVSDALTDISSDATGHAACDIDYDIDQYDCDSWDECEQDSFS